LCERHRADRAACVPGPHPRGLYFDEAAGQRAIDFFSHLRHSKGEWAGSVFVLSPWQQFVIWSLFGWMRSDGRRRYRTAYIEVARKNGKSTLMAGVGLYLFVADKEPGAEIYCAATMRDQAKIIWSEARRMVQSSPSLRRRVGVYTGHLTIDATASKFDPLGGDEDTLDGLNIHGALVDELHAHKTRDLWDKVSTASGSRRQPLRCAITTAGFDRHSICWEQRDYVCKILEGIIEDDSVFGAIYTLDDEDDWLDPKTWVKSNPNLGISVYEYELAEQCKQARETPTAQNSFLRFRMNMWTESETRWIPAERWSACGTPVDPEALRGRQSYWGLDLSSTLDITAWVGVFPPAVMGDKYQVLCRFFVPQNNVADRCRKDRVPYDTWIRQGYIYATPGDVVDQEYIKAQIIADAQIYDIREVAFDRWGSAKLVTELDAEGITTVAFGQGFASMSPASKEAEKLILSCGIAHGNNPVLAWMMSNVTMRTDPAGNIKPDKGKSREKIDGVVAMLMALDRAVRNTSDISGYGSPEAEILTF